MTSTERQKRYRSTEGARTARKAYRSANPHIGRYEALKHRSGWTMSARAAALETQGGRCAICPRKMGDGVCCDHYEPDGVKVPRALLCQACNLSLGYYEKWQRPVGLVITPYEDYLKRFGG